MIPYRVNNIKISFKLKCPNVEKRLRLFAKTSADISKIDGNFFVLRREFVYVVFFTGHVNCTKLKTPLDFAECRKVLLRALQQKDIIECSLLPLRIDNISSSGDIEKRVSLVGLCTFLSERSLPFRFNPQKFPGLCWRIEPVSFTVFTSGKFIAVGARSLSDLSIIVNIFEKYILQFEQNGFNESPRWNAPLSSSGRRSMSR